MMKNSRSGFRGGLLPKFISPRIRLWWNCNEVQMSLFYAKLLTARQKDKHRV